MVEHPHAHFLAEYLAFPDVEDLEEIRDNIDGYPHGTMDGFIHAGADAFRTATNEVGDRYHFHHLLGQLRAFCSVSRASLRMSLSVLEGHGGLVVMHWIVIVHLFLTSSTIYADKSD